ncbi:MULTISPECIES: 5-oxoprolinase subunit PxpB [unclassified Pseudomonas]|uniref:5-oxoprolinase subunit PxpB n=1 Tax=unclassified Pseudomonas TaxID=196821 RepID=UPI000D3806FC|nr:MULTISPECIES: 5-oxoprolinase subunit PxpB [unclassified Pseudomonas]RAU43828.1 allophanate hydrolase subunit 1 [Pseudomonas sp. RIT 409]RAU56278.1 allophanate hydrolase subunit 1 [Pseudomonas sp. RIT 412]
MPSLNLQPVLSVAGTRGIFLNAAQAQFNDQVQSRILSMARTVDTHPFVTETVPGVNSLLVVYEPRNISAGDLMRKLSALWDQTDSVNSPGRLFEIPVQYGGAKGCDLKTVADYCSVSVEEFVRIHSEAEYQVACLGAMPGFPYLTGLDARIQVPRRSSPRLSLDGGSVTIGGSHAGITPCAAPSGWHVIGGTATRLFDPSAEQPALLQPGDRIRFVIEGIQS